MKHIDKLIGLSIALSFAVTAVSHAAEEKAAVKDIKSQVQKSEVRRQKTEDESQKSEKKELTRGELLEHLKATLGHDDEVLNFIPELKKVKDPDGKIGYLYKGKKIEDIDEKSLRGLYSKVHSELTRIRTERLNKQLESIRQAQSAANAAQQASRIQRVVQPPQPPPQQPKTPPTPPQPPRK